MMLGIVILSEEIRILILVIQFEMGNSEKLCFYVVRKGGVRVVGIILGKYDCFGLIGI